jgi:outer membrane protein TolC
MMMEALFHGHFRNGHNNRYRRLIPVVLTEANLIKKAVLCFLLCGSLTNALALTLSEAESIALQADPLVESHKATARSFDEKSVADGTLPDPRLRLGVVNVPVDTFDFKQENMTQIKLGIQQSFPRGDTLELKQQQSKWMANAALAQAEDARLKVSRDVRETYLNLYYEIAANRIVRETRELFSKLVRITESSYAAGRVNQQDVVLADLELSRLDDRATKIQAREESYRAQLAQWVGESAWGALDDTFPKLPLMPESINLNQMIVQHPLIRAQTAKVEASRKETDMARQDYRPGWSATLDYGFRSGNNPNGTERSDFATALVSLDIPLFTSNRQDKNVAANEQKTAAVKYLKDDKLRKLRRMYDKGRHVWERLGDREDLYRNSLLASAKNNSAASLLAYQSGVSEFNTLMRAQITELDVRLEDLRIRVDRAVAQARLLYITGDPDNENE